MFRILSGVFHGCVLALAVTMVILPIADVVFAQNNIRTDRLEYQVENLEKQMENIPATMQTMDRRLTIIETILRDVEGGSVWGQITMGGVGLLLLKEVAQAIRKKGN